MHSEHITELEACHHDTSVTLMCCYYLSSYNMSAVYDCFYSHIGILLLLHSLHLIISFPYTERSIN